MNTKSLTPRILKLARPELKTLAWGTLFLIISSGAGLVYPQLIRKILDDALSQNTASALNKTALFIWIAFIAQGIASSLRYYLFTLAGERIVIRLRETLYNHILKQEVAFFDSYRTGDLMSRLSNDTSVLQSAVSVNISMGIRNLAGVLGGFVMMAITSPTLALSILVVVPPVGFGIARFGKRIRGFSKATQEALGETSHVSEETLSGLRNVRSFSQEEFEKGRYKIGLDKAFAAARARIGQIAQFMNIAFIIGFTAVSVVIWYGGHQVLSGELTNGGLIQFLIYLFIVAFSVGALGGLWGDLMAAVGAAQRVFELLDKKPLMNDEVGDSIQQLSGEIEFQNVHFAYPTRSDLTVLKDISFKLKPGIKVALVGSSGSGKTTVTSLIQRFYEVTQGTILLDGTNIKTLNGHWLREQIGVVAQEPLLISSSVKENILYGNRSASIEQVYSAAREANAIDFIANFTDGFETLVGERGIQLSGGQKQRVAIARALLKDPKILILDEATSALDTESEALVNEALQKLMKGRTTLIIAHRLATIRSADLILVLHEGRIIESGSHEELIAQTQSAYKQLIDKQI